ncbi:hypothetical protein [uncultured Desulfosarcina sp.]|uniref:AAA family ATPase n=1 Tax=uncultured Desulfosarcina sp. TaxID=218289 RepID=UPI0029C9A38A|nr:hypothetical protein [uncultured Desulfosarcina sp.]
MHNERGKGAGGMSDRAKAILVGGSNGSLRHLQKKLGPAVEVVATLDDHASAYTAIRGKAPEAVFIDVASRPAAGLALARQLKRSLPATSLFLVAPDKDPDLLMEGLRIGVADFFCLQESDNDLAAGVRRALDRKDSRTGELTAVFSLKGGQGVTTIATNLADQINATLGERVLLFDMNLYLGDASTFLEQPVAYTPYNLVKDLDRMDGNLLFSSLTRHRRGFYLLAASGEVGDADTIDAAAVRRILGLLQGNLAHTVVDLPHDFSDKTLAVIDAADRVLLLVQQSVPVIRSVQKVLSLFDELGIGENKVRIVVNRHTQNNELTTEDIASVLERPVSAVVRNDHRSLTDALNRGRSLGEMLAEAGVTGDLAALAEQITGIRAPGGRPTGLLQRIGRLLPWSAGEPQP